MNTSNEMPVLPKLPFIIGDLVLIGCAVVIGMIADTPWSAEVLMAVVVCVVLGAAILVAPFLVDYGRREQAELSARQRELAALVEICRESATSAGIAAGSLDSLLNEGRDLNQGLSEEMEAFREQMAELKSELSAADAKRDALLKKQGDASKMTAELKDLGITVAAVNELLQELKESQESLGKKITSLGKEKPAKKSKEKPVKETPDTADEEALLAEASEEEMGVFEDEQEIEEENEPLIEEDVISEETPSPVAEPEEEQEEEFPIEEEINTGEPADTVMEDEEIPESEEEEAEEESASEDNTLFGEDPEEALEEDTPAASVVEKAEPESKPKPKPKKKRNDNTAEFDLGLSDEMEEPKVKKSLSSDGVTRLVVTAYIGIGNNLFVRGEGAGLSWEKGTPLRFISIGKWGWESNDMETPAAIKVYKNDEIECSSLGEVELEPGHHHEMSAFF